MRLNQNLSKATHLCLFLQLVNFLQVNLCKKLTKDLKVKNGFDLVALI